MPQTKILLDTNSYLRLAQDLHPLLAVPYGTEQFTFYVHADLKAECARQPRLANKFDWIRLPKFEQNRKRPLNLSKANKIDIDINFDYMWNHVVADGLSPSRTDVRILATALTLSIRIVTDDRDLLALATEYGVATWTTLDALKSMFDAGHITLDRVRMVVEQWVHDEDLPAADLRLPYEDFFGEKPPPGF